MGSARKMPRIVRVTLDERTVLRRSPEVEQERRVAIEDLLDANYFSPLGADHPGPFNLHLSIEDNRLVFDVRDEADRELARLGLSATPFRSIVKDYFTVCDSYYAAIKTATPGQIEALDMGRRGLHDEGAELLADLMADKAKIDQNTARRLFTLICVLHIRAQ